MCNVSLTLAFVIYDVKTLRYNKATSYVYGEFYSSYSYRYMYTLQLKYSNYVPIKIAYAELR